MKKQIILSLSVIFTLFSIGTGIALYNFVTTTSELGYLISLHEIEDIRQDLHFYVRTTQFYVNASSEHIAENINEIIANVKYINETIRRCHSCHHSPEIEGEIIATQAIVNTFGEKFSYLITAPPRGTWREENRRIASSLVTNILLRVQDMINRATLTIQKKTTETNLAINRSYALLLFCLFFTFIIALFVAQHLTKKVTDPVFELLKATRRIADGEFGFQTDFPATDEFKELMRTFNEMSTSLALKDNENKTLYRDLAQKVEELKKTQRQLVDAEKLTALGTLAGGIAHDFNNILCGILSNIALLRRKQIPHEDESDVLDVIEKAGFRASKLIQQLLTFAQQTKWDVKHVDINEHIKNITELLKNTLHEDIKIDLRLATDLPPLPGDPTRIEQVLMNLLVNSRDAMRQGGGVITVGTALLDLEEDSNILPPDAASGQYVEITVEDTGTGIDEEILPRIFEPFFTTKPFGKGTGLGLSIVHGIVRGHSGFCSVSGRAPHGTKFSVFLPVINKYFSLTPPPPPCS